VSRAGGRGLGARVTRGVRRARWTVRSRVAEHPAYLSVGRRRHGEAVVSESTELVIDGFTRSPASTSARAAYHGRAHARLRERADDLDATFAAWLPPTLLANPHS
jgi:hypothetical protein